MRKNMVIELKSPDGRVIKKRVAREIVIFNKPLGLIPLSWLIKIISKKATIEHIPLEEWAKRYYDETNKHIDYD